MSAKVVVVGAGAVGLYCAARLAERGAQVTVLDGDAEDWSSRGCSASRAAAGMLAPVSEAQAQTPGAHPRAFELEWASLQLWRAAPAWLKPHVRFTGALVLGAFTPPAATTAEPLTARVIAERFGFAATQDGAFVAEEGVVAPLPALHALAEAAKRAGAVVLFDKEVEAIDFKPWRRVRCHDGAAFTADFVVLAPGAWASDALKEIAPALARLRPARGCLAPVALSRSVDVTIRAPDFYLAPRAPGDIVLGSSMEFDVMSRQPDPARIEALFAAAERALPGQVMRADAPAWAGVRPMSPDWSPLIGPDGDDGLLVACGHSRNGWLNAPITAEMISAYVFGDELSQLWRAFSPARFA